MLKLTDEFRKNIADEVFKYEQKTSGEIVTIFIQASDNYPASHYRSGIILGLVGYFAAYAFDLHYSLPFFPLYFFVIFFTLGFLLAHIVMIKRFLTLKSEIDEEVRQKATELFFQLGTHTTKNRNGVLIFLTLVERKIIILGDKAIHEKVGQTFWDQIISDMLPLLRKKQTLEALKLGIQKVGAALEQHYPRQAGDINELKDDLTTT